jgi:hypothetical protein
MYRCRGAPTKVKLSQSFTVGRRDQFLAVGVRVVGGQQHDAFALDRIGQSPNVLLYLKFHGLIWKL